MYDDTVLCLSALYLVMLLTQAEAMVRRLDDLKKKILVGNQFDWANFKSAVTFVSSYVVGVAGMHVGMCVWCCSFTFTIVRYTIASFAAGVTFRLQVL